MSKETNNWGLLFLLTGFFSLGSLNAEDQWKTSKGLILANPGFGGQLPEANRPDEKKKAGQGSQSEGKAASPGLLLNAIRLRRPQPSKTEPGVQNYKAPQLASPAGLTDLPSANSTTTPTVVAQPPAPESAPVPAQVRHEASTAPVAPTLAVPTVNSPQPAPH